MRLLTIITIAILFLSPSGQQALAQSDTPRIEIGTHFSLIQFRHIQSIDPESFTTIFRPPPVRRVNVTDAGFGIRAAYNLFTFLSIEAELNLFPHERKQFEEGGQKLQLLYGAKAGLRKERFGLFGKIRPGVVRFSGLLDCQGPGPGFGCGAQSKSYFALDVGGVIELYPSRRSVIRFDIGDTVINQGRRVFLKAFPQFQDFDVVGFPSETTHNPQFSIGVGIRF